MYMTMDAHSLCERSTYSHQTRICGSGFNMLVVETPIFCPRDEMDDSRSTTADVSLRHCSIAPGLLNKPAFDWNTKNIALNIQLQLQLNNASQPCNLFIAKNHNVLCQLMIFYYAESLKSSFFGAWVRASGYENALHYARAGSVGNGLSQTCERSCVCVFL